MIVDTIRLQGKKVVLVPYKTEHVSTYHAWMENETLRELTASERLTLDEEYEMQRKWRLDEDKLTFIILARKLASGASGPPKNEDVDQFTMVGDVNLFLKGTPPHLRHHETRAVHLNKGDEDEEDEDENFEAELEIMVAEPAYLRQGIAFEAIQLMISFATSSPSLSISDPGETYPQQLPIPRSSLVVRISESNLPSIKLFERVGFRVVKRVEVFKEVEMRWADYSQELGMETR